MLRSVLALTTLALLTPTLAAADTLNDLSSSVVKLYVTSQEWDMSQPWTKKPAAKGTCSGFVIKEGILTNAHCVADSTFIEVEVQGNTDKLEAEVIAISHPTDLALVRVKGADDVLDGLERIKIGELPEQREKVVTVGYPMGGRQISFTEGVVSRIDVMNSAHSGLPILLVQTDAAINPGNSGGPVFSEKNENCVGVATQGNTSGEGLGYFVPTDMIRQFLKDAEDGEVQGIPNLGVGIQTLENDAIRAYLGMSAEQTGIRIRDIAKGSTADGVLEPNDVILSISGHKVLNDGRVKFRESSKIAFGYHIYPKSAGEKVTLTILRDNKVQDVTVTLKPYRFSVIPPMPRYDLEPEYAFVGGVVFMAVELRYLRRWGWSSSRWPASLAAYASTPIGAEGLEELVVISQVYDARVNKGYSRSVENVRVVKVNGEEIFSLADFQSALKKVEGKYLIVELENKTEMVLDLEAVAAEDALIRQRYRIMN